MLTMLWPCGKRAKPEFGLSMRWPAHSALPWIIRGGPRRRHTEGPAMHSLHTSGSTCTRTRSPWPCCGPRLQRVRRARDPQHARGAAQLLSRYPDPRSGTCYEAGPTGYDTHRLHHSLASPASDRPLAHPATLRVRVKTVRTRRAQAGPPAPRRRACRRARPYAAKRRCATCAARESQPTAASQQGSAASSALRHATRRLEPSGLPLRSGCAP